MARGIRISVSDQTYVRPVAQVLTQDTMASFLFALLKFIYYGFDKCLSIYKANLAYYFRSNVEPSRFGTPRSHKKE